MFEWLDRFLLQPGGLVQLVALASCIGGAFALRFGISFWLQYIRKRTKRKIWLSLLDGAIWLLPVLTPLLALLFSGMAFNALVEEKLPTDIFPIAGKFILGWLIVEALLRFVRSRGMQVVMIAVTGILFTMDIFDILTPAIAWSKRLSYGVGKVNITLYGVLSSLLTVIILLWAARLFDTGMDKVLGRVSMRGSTRQLLMKTLNVLLYCVVGMVGLSILGVDITALTVFSGALGVGIGFGLQKIASNFISGIILLMEKSVEVNDMIAMENGMTGLIRQTGARFTLIDTEDGSSHMIPNEQFITQKVVNLTHMGRRGKIDLRLYVAYESDLRLVREIMLKHVANHPSALPEPKPSCFIGNFKEGFVEMVAYYWVADITKGRLSSKTDIYLNILDDFRKNRIALPTPFATRYLDVKGSYMTQYTSPMEQSGMDDGQPDAQGADSPAEASDSSG